MASWVGKPADINCVCIGHPHFACPPISSYQPVLLQKFFPISRTLLTFFLDFRFEPLQFLQVLLKAAHRFSPLLQLLLLEYLKLLEILVNALLDGRFDLLVMGLQILLAFSVEETNALLFTPQCLFQLAFQNLLFLSNLLHQLFPAVLAGGQGQLLQYHTFGCTVLLPLLGVSQNGQRPQLISLHHFLNPALGAAALGLGVLMGGGLPAQALLVYLLALTARFQWIFILSLVGQEGGALGLGLLGGHSGGQGRQFELRGIRFLLLQLKVRGRLSGRRR